MKLKMAFLALLAVLASGCAVGNRYAFDNVVADAALAGSGQVAVAVHDQRAYVLSGDKEPQFVGIQRGGYGNPFDVRTEGDRPLAQDMANSIAATLGRSGFEARTVPALHSDAPAAVRDRLRQSGAERAVLLTVREWKSDAMMRLGLSCDLNMSVLDRAGSVLAAKDIRSTKEVLGPAGMPSGMGKVVGAAFRAKLEEFLADPAIAAALGGK